MKVYKSFVKFGELLIKQVFCKKNCQLAYIDHVHANWMLQGLLVHILGSPLALGKCSSNNHSIINMENVIPVLLICVGEGYLEHISNFPLLILLRTSTPEKKLKITAFMKKY